VVALVFRKLLFAYNNLAKIAKVIVNQSEPLTYKKSVVDNPNLLASNGFIKFVDTGDFMLYFRNSKNDVVKRRSFKLIYKLEIGIIIRNQKFDFYNTLIDNEIKKLEETFTKVNRPTKYIIIGYKNYKSMNEEIQTEIGEIVSYSINRFHFSQINVGYIQDEKKAYFLYSNKYNPSIYFKQGVEFIKKITGNINYIDPKIDL
jgi:hypothetical protein